MAAAFCRYFMLFRVRMDCYFHARGTGNIKIDHSLDQHIRTHDFFEYLGSTVLQLSCPGRDFGALHFSIPMRHVHPIDLTAAAIAKAS